MTFSNDEGRLLAGRSEAKVWRTPIRISLDGVIEGLGGDAVESAAGSLSSITHTSRTIAMRRTTASSVRRRGDWDMTYSVEDVEGTTECYRSATEITASENMG